MSNKLRVYKPDVPLIAHFRGQAKDFSMAFPWAVERPDGTGFRTQTWRGAMWQAEQEIRNRKER